MRIIGGKWKGLAIPIDKKFKGRPTTDFAREGLMNTLHHLVDWEEAQVLDLFAGTGAFSLEAISRGATSALALDIQVHHVAHIQKVAKEWNIRELVATKANSFEWIQKCTQRFEVIFADPPYDHPQLTALPELCWNSLKENGILIVEHDKRIHFDLHPHFLKEKKYGNVHFTFFTKLAE